MQTINVHNDFAAVKRFWTFERDEFKTARTWFPATTLTGKDRDISWPNSDILTAATQ